MLRTSLLVPLACVMLLRQGLCSCSFDDGPCEYEETPLVADDETPWATTVGMDIAALEVPQHGTWRWNPSIDELEIDEGGTELPAWASFVHDSQTIRYSEHVGGGVGVSCNGPMVLVDGMLTFTDEQDVVIVSVPVTVQRQLTAEDFYYSSPQYSPITTFSTGLHKTIEFDTTQIVGSILWLERGLLAEFSYHGQRMLTETTGNGVLSLIAKFEAD